MKQANAPRDATTATRRLEKAAMTRTTSTNDSAIVVSFIS